MTSSFEQCLAVLNQPAELSLLRSLQRGIEKESLRIQPNGQIAQTPHPLGLGSALTHAQITTDYSEALLEFITDVHTNAASCLQELSDIHAFVYSQLDNEKLWTASMPCILPEDNLIPIARYGTSNVAKMKEAYRSGLGLRYGRLMQTIAGIHYNFSLPDKLWQSLMSLEDAKSQLCAFKTDRYFSMIRNFRRIVWLPVYLFGASPAVCSTFLQGRRHRLQPLGQGTLGAPLGTSLRMGDLGYQSSAQETLFVSYNSLQDYISSLLPALLQPHPDYEKFGVTDAQGQHQQLSTSLLQIENEFYSAIRPKQPTRSGEAPLIALAERGVEYVEVRCIDINPYAPLGIDEQQIDFIDTLLLYCLLKPSADLNQSEHKETMANLGRVVYFGRDPQLRIEQHGNDVLFQDRAKEILEDMTSIAQLLDRAHDGDRYQTALAAQRQKIEQPSLTPSAQILADLKSKHQSYFSFAMEKANLAADYFLDHPLSQDNAVNYREKASNSLALQQQMEKTCEDNFSDYLARYYLQYQSLQNRQSTSTTAG